MRADACPDREVEGGAGEGTGEKSPGVENPGVENPAVAGSAESGPPTGPASLDELDDDSLLALYRAHPSGSAERAGACEVLVRRFTPLVRACVRHYRGSPEPTDDLMQVGYVGLLKAINGFDPSFGRELRSYAVPCITGEVKRHFRDKRWQVRVSRPVQELLLEVRGATDDLTQELGRRPDEAELADRLGVTAEALREARQAAGAFSALSLNAPTGDGDDAAELGELLGEEDADVNRTVDMEAVSTHWSELPVREQRILVMRFYGNLTQEEIAGRLGISQMHVSRLQARALARLRDRLLDPPEASSRRSGNDPARH